MTQTGGPTPPVGTHRGSTIGQNSYTGNAYQDGSGNGGWLLGHFVSPEEGILHSDAVEIKWGVHPAGDHRVAWVRNERRTACLVLVQGTFHVLLPERTVELTTPGDYVVWGPGTDHSWFAPEYAVVLTVRWPSIPGYVGGMTIPSR